MNEPELSVPYTHNNQPAVLEVWRDPDPLSPRESENLGVMVYQHRSYVLGDERIREGSFAEYLDNQGIDPEKVISWPLYVLDHSVLHISVEDFQDPWDSGCVGAVYTTHAKIEEAFGVVDGDTLARAAEYLRSEVEDFNSFLNGDVFGFRLRVQNEHDQWNTEDEVWGFYGSDHTTNGLLDSLDANSAQALSQALQPNRKRPSTF